MCKEQRERELKEKFYFLKQKFIGVVTIVGTIVVCNSGLLYNEEIQGNDWTIALLSIPFGLILIFTKEKYWMDDYFFECEADEYELEDELEEYDDEYEEDYDEEDYDEVSMSDILIAAFQEVRNIFQSVKYYISRCKISKPVR